MHVFFSLKKIEPERNEREPEAVDEAAELLSHALLPQPHLVPRAAARHEAHVPQPGGRGGALPGHRRRQIQRQRERGGRLKRENDYNGCLIMLTQLGICWTVCTGTHSVDPSSLSLSLTHSSKAIPHIG